MKKACLPIVIILLLQIVSCSYNSIADYDQQTVDKIIEVYRTINLFYINMAEYETNDRQYDKFSAEYKRIEVELQTLVLMNKLRSNNDESTKQAENILGLWIKYKNAHKEKDTYKEIMMKENLITLNRNLEAIAKGEEFKKD